MIIRLNKKLLTGLLRPYLDRGFFAFVMRMLFIMTIAIGVPQVLALGTFIVMRPMIESPAPLLLASLIIFYVPVIPTLFLAGLLFYERIFMLVGLYRLLGFRDYALRNKLCAWLNIAV